MTESGGACIHTACDNFSKYLIDGVKFPVEFKPKQRQAVEALLKGSDVLAIYGKSFIFQVFAAAAANIEFPYLL